MEHASKQERQTKYCRAVEEILQRLSHATNSQLLTALREIYPNVSATTVHRTSARLAARGRISIAPPGHDGTIRYDVTTTPHDHFLCSRCGLLRDVNVKSKVALILEEAIDGYSISGRLTISGICKECSNQTEPRVLR